MGSLVARDDLMKIMSAAVLEVYTSDTITAVASPMYGNSGCTNFILGVVAAHAMAYDSASSGSDDPRAAVEPRYRFPSSVFSPSEQQLADSCEAESVLPGRFSTF